MAFSFSLLNSPSLKLIDGWHDHSSRLSPSRFNKRTKQINDLTATMTTTTRVFMYLEYGECLPVCDAFESLAVNGEDSVAFLDAAIPVGHTPANHFMNLREYTKHKNDDDDDDQKKKKKSYKFFKNLDRNEKGMRINGNLAA